MKKAKFFLSLSLLVLMCNSAKAQDSTNFVYYPADQWLYYAVQTLNEPILNQGSNIAGESFKTSDFFKMIALPDVSNSFPAEKRKVNQAPKSELWQKKMSTKSGYFNLILDPKERNDNQYAYTVLVGYIDVKKYQEIDLKMESASPYEIYLDGNKLFSSNDFAKDGEKNKHSQKVKMELGKHSVFVKSLYQKKEDKDWLFKLEIGTKESNSLSWTLDPKSVMNIGLILDGTRLNGVDISPNGRFVKYSYSETKAPEGKSSSWSEIYDIKSNRLVFNTKYNKMGYVEFHPTKDAIVFQKDENGKTIVYQQDLDSNEVTILMEAPDDMNFFVIDETNTFIIYGVNVKGEKNKDGVNRLDGMSDRWPWWRNQTMLYKYDLNTGVHRQLTAGNLSTSLMNIRHDGKKIIVSQSVEDYSQRPYTRQIMMEIDLSDLSVDTLWNTFFGGSVQYSPDGKQLLVAGSAAMFDGVGKNLPKKMIPNDYDYQAFIYTIETKEVKPITKDFNPSINGADWCPNDGRIYFHVEEKTFQKIYVYDINKGVFEEIKTDLDIVKGMRKASNSSVLAYYGNGIQSPEHGGVIDVKSGKILSESNPEKERFSDVIFGDYQDYTFKSKSGGIIDGYFYLPPDFDSSKKYPMIVYYYGGTSPTERSFRGRYPKNYFAANGYVVYVVIPSGSTGYGQEFSARHVNNWGITVADEIIEGTKKFIKDHDFVDAEHVGCMGASYGGFMTMLLTTRTDIFAAAISHAGISSISSYWGEGYWGYQYNTVAAAGTFPWDNQKMYVGQSALFNADKCNTPLLLLHGTADTNVPEGESIQLYAALKLLGKDCELVEIEGENHHIVDYKKRIKWQKTIMAWFEKYLKVDAEWWEALYESER